MARRYWSPTKSSSVSRSRLRTVAQLSAPSAVASPASARKINRASNTNPRASPAPGLCSVRTACSPRRAAVLGLHARAACRLCLFGGALDVVDLALRGILRRKQLPVRQFGHRIDWNCAQVFLGHQVVQRVRITSLVAVEV